MIKIVVGGIALVLGVELLLLVGERRSLTLVVTGVVVGVVLLSFRAWLPESAQPTGLEEADLSPAESLDRWRARTEMMVGWADGTRGEWDRHLRPLLAREFAMATGHRVAKDARAHDASGRMLFGAELWPWIDPAAVAPYQDKDQPAPGRAALDEILQRLEKL